MAAWLGIQVGTLERIIWTVGVLVVYLVVRALLRRLVRGSTHDAERRYTATKVVNTTLGIVVVLALALVWTRGGTGVAAYLGIVSAGVAIALQDPLSDLAGFLFIAMRRPFAVGDRIQIGEHRGDVIDIRIFQFTLMEIGNWVQADQSTGRLIHIPNGRIFQEALANYSKGFAYLWNELPVLLTFESNWRKGKAILEQIATKDAEPLSKAAEESVKLAARKFMIFYTHLSPVVYTKIADSGVLLTIRYLCEPRKRRSSEERISEDILTRFAECPDIDFAYPTYRLYDNVREGKPEARAEPLPPERGRGEAG